MNILFPPLHRAGWPFIGLFVFLTCGLFLLSSALGMGGVVLTLWCVYFFRNPHRITPLGEGLVISPADGLITKIEIALPPQELEWKKTPLTRVSIFLNVFDVHVTRIPVEGEIMKIAYHPGSFVNASLDKASELNERNSVLIKTASGQEVLVVQIAGLIARRILSEAKTGQTVGPGDVFGIIRFGSRVDIYLPEGVNPQVIEGQYMLGGETVMADLTSKAPQRVART